MKWKQELPTEPGWYWFRNTKRKDEAEPCIFYVREYAGGLAINNSTLKGWPSKEAGEWAGPIEQPED